MSNTHKQPEESGAVLVSVDGTLPTAADLHVRVSGNPEEWRRKLEALKEPGVVRWFLTVGDCLAHEAGTLKGRRLHDTTETGGRLPDDALEQVIRPEALRILGGESRFSQKNIALAMAYANAIEREKAGARLEDVPFTDCAMLLWSDIPFGVGETPELEERNARIIAACRVSFLQGMKDAGGDPLLPPWRVARLSGILPPWRVAALSETAADVARWSPQNGETWEQAGARYTLLFLRNIGRARND